MFQLAKVFPLGEKTIVILEIYTKNSYYKKDHNVTTDSLLTNIQYNTIQVPIEEYYSDMTCRYKALCTIQKYFLVLSMGRFKQIAFYIYIYMMLFSSFFNHPD